MKKQSTTQQGFVSIIVAMILIALISLIAVGFAYLVRQNQRTSMNRQLSTQAFYAAESGVNDAVQRLRQSGAYQKNDCQGTGAILTPGVEYTCVLVNSRPDTLVFDSVSMNESTIAHIASVQQIRSLQIAWQEDTGSSAQFAAANGPTAFPQQPSWSGCPTSATSCEQATAQFPNSIGVLRATIFPANSATSIDTLLNASQTVFMYPAAATTTGGGAVDFRPYTASGDQSKEGLIVSGGCNANNTPRKCVVTINNINSNDLFLRLKAIYKNAAVTVTAKDSSGTNVPISGAQATIDSTGKSQDVLRRIQVRVPLNDAYYFPEFALESSDTICKRLATYPNSTYANGGQTYAGRTWAVDPPALLYPTNNAAKDSTACAYEL